MKKVYRYGLLCLVCLLSACASEANRSVQPVEPEGGITGSGDQVDCHAKNPPAKCDKTP